MAAEADAGVIVDVDGSRWVEIEEEVEEEIEEQVAAGSAADSGFQNTASNEIDDEIRDVFIEEVQEEIDNLRAQLPLWRAKPDDLEQIKPIRRSFHTLKGSGRLVGALALASSAGRSRTCSIACSTVPLRPARKRCRWSNMRSMPCRGC